MGKKGLTYENVEVFKYFLSDQSIIPRKTLQSIRIFDVTSKNINLFMIGYKEILCAHFKTKLFL